MKLVLRFSKDGGRLSVYSTSVFIGPLIASICSHNSIVPLYWDLLPLSSLPPRPFFFGWSERSGPVRRLVRPSPV